MAGDEYEIEAYESSFEEMGKSAVADLSFGSGAFTIEGHTHDDGSVHEGMSGVTYSIFATTFDGVKHELMFTPSQTEAMARDMAQFILNLGGNHEASE